MDRDGGVISPEPPSSPDDESVSSSFHTPQHAPFPNGSVMNFVTSQDSLDVFHDAMSFQPGAPVKSLINQVASLDRRRHISSGATFEDARSTCEDELEDDVTERTSMLKTGSSLARVRHSSYGHGSPLHAPREGLSFSTNSLKKNSLYRPKVARQEILQHKPLKKTVSNISTQTSTNRKLNSWMLNYVPCAELDAFLNPTGLGVGKPPLYAEESEKVNLPTHMCPGKKAKIGCCRRIREEFALSNFKLEHNAPHLFVTSQWQTPNGMSCLYLAYRLFWAVYFLMWAIWSFVGSGGYEAPISRKRFYFVFLTNWSIWLLAVDTFLQAVNVAVHMKRIVDGDGAKYFKMPRSFRVSWVLSNITMTSHLFVTILFWAVVYPTSNFPFSVISVNTHIVPCCYVFIDLLVSATPRRITHVYLPMLYLTVYGVFTDIYYLCGGTNPKGSRVLYPILDWSKPAETLLVSSGLVLIVIPILHWLIICSLYGIRLKLWRNCKLKRCRQREDKCVLQDQKV